MNAPAKSPNGSSWGLFITVPICLLLIIYFLTSGLRSPEKQVTVEILKSVWHTPKTARGEEQVNIING
jgi:hypothetical protein